MAARIEIGRDGEAKARKYLISKGFEIIDTNSDKPLYPYDILVKMDEITYAINVKSVTSEKGLFGIQLSNVKKLLRHSEKLGAKMAYLTVYKDNFALFVLDKSYSDWKDLGEESYLDAVYKDGKMTFVTSVRPQKSNLPGAFGRINSKGLAPFIDDEVEVTVRRITKEKKQEESKSNETV